MVVGSQGIDMRRFRAEFMGATLRVSDKYCECVVMTVGNDARQLEPGGKNLIQGLAVNLPFVSHDEPFFTEVWNVL